MCCLMKRVSVWRWNLGNSAMMMFCRYITIGLLLTLGALVPVAHALQEPRSIATDFRLRTVRYSPNEVFRFEGHYGYQSSIEFHPDETVQTVSLGDSVAWLVEPAKDRLFIKPIEQDAMTNMTVITDRHTYHFELHASETEDIRDKGMVFVMRFAYPDDDLAAMDYGEDDIPDYESEPEKYNFNYTIQGSELISPIRIFDDGEFTYFEFRDKNADVPAFFFVDAAGNEELVNFRTRGNYVAVERVSPVFTLRRGAYIACVYNESMQHEVPPPQPGFWDKLTSGEFFRM